MKTSLALLGASIAVAVGTAYGQIVTYDFASTYAGTLGAGVTGGATVTAGNFGFGLGITQTSGLLNPAAGNASAEGFNLAASGLGDTAEGALANNNFFTLSITRNSGTTWSLGNLTFSAQGQNASGGNSGPDSIAVYASTTANGTYSLLGTSVSGIKGNASFPGTSSIARDLSSFNSSLSVFIRIVGFSGAGSNGDLLIDNVAIAGTAVPEPEEYAALAGMALIGFGVWRKWAARRA